MKRPLEYIAGGFVLGEVLALLPVVWMVGILTAVTAGVCYLWKRDGRSLLWWLLPFACAAGLLCVRRDLTSWQEYRRTAETVKGEKIRLWGTVWGIRERKGREGLTLELKDVAFETEGGRESFGAVLAYVDEPDRELAVGMGLGLTGELALFDRARNPGEFDLGKYYHALGIEGRFYGKELEVCSEDSRPYFEAIRGIRSRAAGVIDSICGEKDRGIFRAMVLGEKSELSAEIRKLYQSSGIAHLLAVSGLHISMIGLGTFGILRKMGMGPAGSGLLGGIVTVSYGVLAGGPGISASVVRAVIMALAQMTAVCLGRTYDLRTALGVSALTLLLQSPTLLFQAGFQLSFGAVLALGAAEPVVEKWLGAQKGYQKTLLAGAVIQLATCPVILYHYFEYPPYGIMLNLMVIPLMSWVLLSGILGTALGSLSIAWGTGAIGAGHYVLEFYQWICEKTQSLPGSLVVAGRPEKWQMGIYALGWAVFLTIMWLKAEREESGGECLRGTGLRRLAGFILFAAGSLGILMIPVPPRDLTVTFLDVGQGDGICIRAEDLVILVDGGSTDRKNLGTQVLEPFLKSQGIRQVDYVIVSHGDQDHISGIQEILEEDSGIRVKNLVLPWLGRDGTDEVYGKLEKQAEDHGAAVAWMKRGDCLRWNGLKIDCLYSGESWQMGTAGDRNDHSLLLRVGYGMAGILLTGDMSGGGEHRWLEYGEAPSVQVLKVAHHGSAYSTEEEFLRRIQPELAVISCGEGNRYGHPAPETVERLKDQGILWYLTQERGAVMVETDGEKLGINTYIPETGFPR